ncbi:GNAT family N-acetyltransferase [Micromonospora sp. NPDC048170]|uniref:GNAT family N-acetyltransferase n=1 Tax=Micromonospora sp. NPDC048170 TaxID=3154819 RepID=UPI00340614BF
MQLVQCGVSVRRATIGDSDRLAALLAEALMDASVGAWLVPDKAERRPVLERYCRFAVEHGLEYGSVDTTDDVAAVAIWYPRIKPMPQLSRLLNSDLRRLVGAYVERFELLHVSTASVHPFVPHHCLAHLAVGSRHRGRGLGSRLLMSHQRVLDEVGLPAYTESTIERHRTGLYARLGYTPRCPVLLPLAGLALWRMWRQPATRAGATGLDALLPRRVRAHRRPVGTDSAAWPVMPAALPLAGWRTPASAVAAR